MNNFRRTFIFSLVLILTFSGIVVSGFWKDKGNVRVIEVYGNVTISKNELFDFARLTDSMIYNNVVSLEAVESRLLKHPNIRDVSVSRDGGKIKIAVVEKRPFAIVTNGKKIFLADNNLTVYEMKKYPDYELDLPVISGFSDEISPGLFGRDDLKKLQTGHYIISTAAKISKMLYNIISEINLSDPENVKIITSDDATVIYFLDNNFLLTGDNYRRNFSRNTEHELLQRTIDLKLNYLYSFLVQVKLYKPYGSYEYIDLRYNDVIIVKHKY